MYNKKDSRQGDINKDFISTDIIRDARYGDKLAFVEILNKCVYMVESISSNYFLTGGDDSDLVQEGYIGLWKAVKSYDESKNCTFKHFASLCITRNILTAIRASKRKKHMPLNGYQSFSAPIYVDSSFTLLDKIKDYSGKSPLEECLYEELIENVEKVIDEELSDLERQVLKLYIKGLSYIEMSELLNKKSKSIDNALQRAKKKLFMHLDLEI